MDKDLFDKLSALEAEQKILDEKFAAMRQQALDFLRLSIAKFGFTAAELGLCCGTCGSTPAAAKEKKTRKPVAPKYRNPAGEQTWTGRGARPVWFRQALEAGITPEEMLIGAGE